MRKVALKTPDLIALGQLIQEQTGFPVGDVEETLEGPTIQVAADQTAVSVKTDGRQFLATRALPGFDCRPHNGQHPWQYRIHI